MSDEQVFPRITVHDGGWLLVRTSNLWASVRVHVDEDGRLRTVAALVQAADATGGQKVPIRGEDLRTFPLAAVEAQANGPLRDEILAGIDGSATLRLFSAGILEAIDDVGKIGESEVSDAPPKRGAHVGKTDLTLELPIGKPYPDDFYATVALRYWDAMSLDSNRPAALLAEANDKPLKTVHRWVAEARKRGHLPQGRAGKAG